ncbi:MAG: hypothetical protein K2Q23_02700 [Bryobacteraceae bacterium]|nr:hypothetical protein [Bryobacteraceae bacterium]
MSDDAGRRLVLVTGPAGLRGFLGRSPYEMLQHIGYTYDYITERHASGCSFWLVIFSRPKTGLHIATWTNFIDVAAATYPQVGTILKGALKELRSTPFAQFEEQAGFSFADVHSLGVADPRFMNAERLLESDRSPLAVRRFLYHTLRMTELFTGDGITMQPDLTRGCREYVTKNSLVCALPALSMAELDLEIPAV